MTEDATAVQERTAVIAETLNPDLLRKAAAYYGAVRRTAARCSRNFEWLHVNRGKFIPCLDTEIIISALYDVRANTRSKESISTDVFTPENDWHDLSRISGPHILRYYLSTMT